MNETGNAILSHTGWLYTKLFEGPFFFFDLWSLAHLYSGFLVMLVLRALHVRRPWTWLVSLLVAYELLELAFIYVAFHAFRPETLKDQGTDILVGMAGAWVTTALVRRGERLRGPARESLVRGLAVQLGAVAVAFEWVGNYGYSYSRPFFNSPGICWWAFLLWGLGLVAVGLGFSSFERRLGSAVKALALTQLGYLAALAVVEYLGYVVFGIHEVGHPDRTALVFDLAHGTRTMHAFYTFSPVVGVLVFVGLRALFRRAMTPSLVLERATEESPVFARARS